MRTKLLIAATATLGTITAISLLSDLDIVLEGHRSCIQEMFEELQYVACETMHPQ
ncbi:MAG: hypothetical protein NC548_05965 [Lachnospiraceae bacterium]|nr:hypothetical protein [Lachnospiraceae bacterium]